MPGKHGCGICSVYFILPLTNFSGGPSAFLRGSTKVQPLLHEATFSRHNFFKQTISVCFPKTNNRGSQSAAFQIWLDYNSQHSSPLAKLASGCEVQQCLEGCTLLTLDLHNAVKRLGDNISGPHLQRT